MTATQVELAKEIHEFIEHDVSLEDVHSVLWAMAQVANDEDILDVLSEIRRGS